MKRLSKEQILMLHRELINAFGGEDGIRDTGALESAINAPFQTFDGIALYPSLISKAARLCFGIVKNHPFIDGNKRTGAHCMLVFLALNNIELEYADGELISIVLDMASGKTDSGDLRQWLSDHAL